MNRLLVRRSASLSALAIVVACGMAGRAAMPYLPLIGPPPLRIQLVRSPATAKVDGSPARPAEAPNSATAATSQTSSADSDDFTNPFGINLDSYREPTGNPKPATEKPDITLDKPFSAGILELPTPDLQGISPQLLSTYFRPIRHGTNSAVLVGLSPLSFLPPLPPDKSSKATYIVK